MSACDVFFEGNGIGKYCSNACKTEARRIKSLLSSDDSHTRKRKIIYESRRQQGRCANCPETNIDTFEFAHFERGTKKIGRKALTNASYSELTEELTRGNWLCSFCHRISTQKEWKEIYTSSEVGITRIRRHKIFSIVNDIKYQIGSCQMCRRIVTPETVVAFEFDHMVQGEKLANVSALIQRRVALDRIRAEIAKCLLVCANCHRISTKTQALENAQRVRLCKELPFSLSIKENSPHRIQAIQDDLNLVDDMYLDDENLDDEILDDENLDEEELDEEELDEEDIDDEELDDEDSEEDAGFI